MEQVNLSTAVGLAMLKGVFLEGAFPLFPHEILLEYQLDMDRVGILVSEPYKDKYDSEWEWEGLAFISPSDAYAFLKAVYKMFPRIHIWDMTVGDYKHPKSQEETLKEFTNFFEVVGGSRPWIYGKETTNDSSEDLIKRMEMDEAVSAIVDKVGKLHIKYPQAPKEVVIEYQLELDRTVVMLGMPYTNNEDTDTTLVRQLFIQPTLVHEFLTKVGGLFDYISISDMTKEYNHPQNKEETLKEFTQYFTASMGGREWK